MKICSVENCNKKHVARGFCDSHYHSARKNNKLLNIQTYHTPKICKIDNCNNRVKSNGYCRGCLRKEIRNDNKELLSKLKIGKCSLDGCQNLRNGKYCDKHKNLDIKRRYRHSINIAKKRGIEWTLNLEEYSNLIKSNCFYCNSFIGFGVGLDRKNSLQGYVVLNVVPCCKDCNKLKNNLLTTEEMLQVISLLRNIRNSKNIWKKEE